MDEAEFRHTKDSGFFSDEFVLVFEIDEDGGDTSTF